MRFYPPHQRLIVTMFPNSTAPGLNKIAFELMGKSAAGRSFPMHRRAMVRAKMPSKRPLPNRSRRSEG